jgi:hypothetical protein
VETLTAGDVGRLPLASAPVRTAGEDAHTVPDNGDIPF